MILLRAKCLLCLLIAVCICPFLHAAGAPPQTTSITIAPAAGTLAPTPPMGWASWNHYFCDYTEKTIREQADALVSTGMRDAGYQYVVIQECIAKDRDAQGNLLSDKERFPNGMPALVAYIHKLHLKAGIYTDIGKHTCYPNPRYQGSYGHEQQDANTFASWGIDFVEMDYCNREIEHTGRWVYERMAAAIRATGRPMIFYLCAWGNEQPWEWALGSAQMWRTEYDVSLEKNHVEWQRMWRNFESNTVHSVLTGPESWNDADMLEVGNPGLNDTEAEAQMSMWAISPSPLLAGADLVHMSARSKAIYTNREVIAINQDTLGSGAEKLKEAAPGLEIWVKPLGSRMAGDLAVMLLNASDQPATMGLQWSELDLLPGPSVRNVWTHTSSTNSRLGYQNRIAAHSAILLKVKGTRAWTRGVVYQAEWPGLQRGGAATLFPCGECSAGYAMALGAETAAGSLRLQKIEAPTAGAYTVRILYTRNGLEDKQISLSVNGNVSEVKAIMRSWNWVDIPVLLKAGDNEIIVSYKGKDSFYIDELTLFQGQISQ